LAVLASQKFHSPKLDLIKSHRDSGAAKHLASEAAVQRARRAAFVHEWLVEEGNAGVHVNV